MKFFTYGDENKEKVLLLHPMFTGAKFFGCAISQLKEKYFLIVPVLSGHYEGSEYISDKIELSQLETFLSSRGITKLKAVIGFSLGGNIAFEFFCRNLEITQRLIIDSAPLFKFPEFVKQRFYKKYKRCLEEVRLHPEYAAETLNKCFNCMGEFQKETAPSISQTSLKNLVESCFNNALPALDCDCQKKIMFIYGAKDIARLCRYRIKKYRHAGFATLKGYSHCQLFTSKTKEYFLRFLGED